MRAVKAKASTPPVTALFRRTRMASSPSPTANGLKTTPRAVSKNSFLKFAIQLTSNKTSPSSPKAFRRDTLRRYLKTRFYKDHVQTYKKRPIYWLFTSGPRKALQCLVYLHRYKDSTLARMRTEYVLPLQGRMAAKEERLVGDIAAPTSTHHRAKLEKERETLIKLQAELRDFDNRLRHYANLRVRLDLDDGVKVNYGKFGDLLADVKSIAR